MDWTAAGTLVLAGFTGWLAWETRGMVTEARRELGVQRTALELQLEPRLVPIADSPPRALTKENLGGSAAAEYVQPFEIAVENVGNGMAQIEQVEISVDSWSPTHRVLFTGAVRSGGRGSLRGDFITEPPDKWTGPAELAVGDVLHVLIRYKGAGERRYLVQFSWLRERGQGVWRFTLDSEQGHLELPDPVRVEQ